MQLVEAIMHALGVILPMGHGLVSISENPLRFMPLKKQAPDNRLHIGTMVLLSAAPPKPLTKRQRRRVRGREREDARIAQARIDTGTRVRGGKS